MFQYFPNEVVLHISSFLQNREDIFAFASTCKLANALVKGNKFVTKEVDEYPGYYCERTFTFKPKKFVSVKSVRNDHMHYEEEHVYHRKKLVWRTTKCSKETLKGRLVRGCRQGKWFRTFHGESDRVTCTLYDLGQELYIQSNDGTGPSQFVMNSGVFCDDEYEPGVFQMEHDFVFARDDKATPFHCEGKDHPTFRKHAFNDYFFAGKTGGKGRYSLCCEKHRKEMPKPLF